MPPEGGAKEDTMRDTLRDQMLWTQITVLEALAAGRARVRALLARPVRDERGQTPTEYLMIVGLMAMVIIVAFTVYFWPTIQQATKDWSGNVRDAILGKQIGK
jgi:Flp pilus assembly pilin Flp